MKLLKLSAALLPAILLFACNNNAEKKEETAPVKKDTVVQVAAPKAQYDTIEIYHYKGNEPYINNEFIKNCSEQEKALMAYYCYFFNTSCTDTKHCKLTEALGLGEQNSAEHKKLVLKWFTDEETKQLAKEGGRATPDKAENTAWYEELKMVKKAGSLVTIRYLSVWKTKLQEGKGRGTDEYEFEPNRIKVIGRLHEDI